MSLTLHPKLGLAEPASPGTRGSGGSESSHPRIPAPRTASATAHGDRELFSQPCWVTGKRGVSVACHTPPGSPLGCAPAGGFLRQPSNEPAWVLG